MSGIIFFILYWMHMTTRPKPKNPTAMARVPRKMTPLMAAHRVGDMMPMMTADGKVTLGMPLD
ncbi:MAG: hypothetical protein FWG00_05935 [Coriobacteriia bacterium]|nr:hypothetical protein [Coriobacteriia bacterium]